MEKLNKTDLVLNAVAKTYGISITAIRNRSRIAKIAEARQVSAYLLRELYNLSFPQIGRIVGGRDHSTIIHAYQKISSKINKDSRLRSSVDSILKLTNIVPVKDVKQDPRWALIGTTQQENENEIIYKIETSEDILRLFQNIDLTERERLVLTQYRQGLTLGKIADHLKLSRQRIMQIVQKSLLKDLGSLAQQGYKINVKEYLLAEKKAHEFKQGKIPEDIRKDILEDVTNLSDTKSLNELSKKYSISAKKLKEEFPEINTILEKNSLDRKKRWSRFYVRCRRCNTDQVPHKMWGYCNNCYYKTENFKEIQRRSFEKHIDERRAKNRKYTAQYTSRPEVMEKMRLRNDLKFYDGNREKSIEYNGSKCTNCGIDRQTSLQKGNKDFHVMHRDHNPKNNSLSNLRPVCSDCFYKIQRTIMIQGNHK